MKNCTVIRELSSTLSQRLCIIRWQGRECFCRELFSLDAFPLYLELRSHPSAFIPEIRDVYADQGHLIIIEELVPGETLAAWMAGRQLDSREIRLIVDGLCEAVAFIHGLAFPVIHRDIKPENIMITPAGVKLIDFSIARIKSGAGPDTRILGSVGYAAPEQYGFRPTDQRSDIYSVGVVINQLLTGHYPNELLPEGAEAKVVRKATSLDPLDRYPDIKSLKYAFDHSYCRRRDWTLPGFRTHTRWKMILAAIGYLAALAFFVSEEPEEPVHNIWEYRTVYASFLVFSFFYFFNYLNVFDYLPWHDSTSKARIYLGRALVYLGLFYLWALLVGQIK